MAMKSDYYGRGNTSKEINNQQSGRGTAGASPKKDGIVGKPRTNGTPPRLKRGG